MWLDTVDGYTLLCIPDSDSGWERKEADGCDDRPGHYHIAA